MHLLKHLLPEMVKNRKVVIFHKFQPTSLLHVELFLGENVFEAFVVHIDLTRLSV